MLAPYPIKDGYKDIQAVNEFSQLQLTVDALRNIRSENKLSPSVKMHLAIKCTDSKKKPFFEKYTALIQSLANISEIEFSSNPPKPAAFSPQKGFELYVPLAGLVDIKVELERLQKEFQKAEQDRTFLERRLSDEKYKKNAPAQLIEKDQEKLKLAQERIQKIKVSIDSLQT